jgi:hypothetical protein
MVVQVTHMWHRGMHALRRGCIYLDHFCAAKVYLIGRRPYIFSRRDCWCFSQLIGWIDFSCKRSLYFLLHNKNPQTEERVFPHWVFLGVIYPKIFVFLMVVIGVIFFFIDHIYFSAVHLKFVKKPSYSHKEQFQKFKLNWGNNFWVKYCCKYWFILPGFRNFTLNREWNRFCISW